MYSTRAADSTFEFPSRVNLSGPTVPSTMNRTSRCNKVDAVRLYASYMLNLLLLKGQICVSKPQNLLHKNKQEKNNFEIHEH